MQGSDGNFYGTTLRGGIHEAGSVFQISPGGNVTLIYSFCDESLCCVDGGADYYCGDGMNPYAGLIQDSSGYLYGTTPSGGAYNFGAVFGLDTNGNYAVLYSSGGMPGGVYPYAGLVEDGNGNFYGTTEVGGSGDISCFECGTVFRINSNGSYTNLYSFGTHNPDGKYPMAALVQGSDGNFYGTTSQGGTYSNGTVFQITPSGEETVLHSFGRSPNDGANPSWNAALVQGSDGNFYGTTEAGGTSTNCYGGCGTVFKLTAGGGGGGGGDTNCTYTLSATSVTLAAKGGSKTVKVKVKGADCSWTAGTTNSWITITSGSDYMGSGTVRYTVPGNTNNTGLIGTMTIAGQTLTVNQKPGGCTFKLSPESRKFKAAGGTGAVKVTPNFSDCAWTATSTNDWIAITGGASGVRTQPVNYTVAANTSTNVLTGSITIAGETFTVTQAGEK